MYVLLWLQLLAIPLLLLAVALAVWVRFIQPRRITLAALLTLTVLPPIVLAGGVLAYEISLQRDNVQLGYAWPAGLWLGCYLLTAVLIFRAARRRVHRTDGTPGQPAAANWSSSRIIGVVAAVAALHIGTLLYVDAGVCRKLEPQKPMPWHPGNCPTNRTRRGTMPKQAKYSKR
jgi:hypothetical protein